MHQGEVYWLRFRGEGSESRGRRPALVVQHDRFNRSAIATTVVAAITSNLRLAAMPGNVRLRERKPLFEVQLEMVLDIPVANLLQQNGRQSKREPRLDPLGDEFG